MNAQDDLVGHRLADGASHQAPSAATAATTGATAAATTTQPISSSDGSTATVSSTTRALTTNATTSSELTTTLTASTSEDELDVAERLKKKIRTARLKPSGHLENLRPKIDQISEVYQRTILNGATMSMLEKFERIGQKDKAADVTKEELLAFLGHLIDSFSEFALCTRYWSILKTLIKKCTFP